MLSFITWDVSPVIFKLGFFTLRWYSLAFMVGFLVGYEIVARMFRHEGAPERWLGLLLMWTVAGTIVGARLGHVFFYEWDLFSQNPIKILYVWEGGLASHGGAIGVILGVILFSIVTTKRSPLWTFDRLVVPIALVGGLIRLGNLMNSEIFGHATTLPWGFRFVNSPEAEHRPPHCQSGALLVRTAYGQLSEILLLGGGKSAGRERHADEAVEDAADQGQTAVGVGIVAAQISCNKAGIAQKRRRSVDIIDKTAFLAQLDIEQRVHPRPSENISDELGSQAQR